MKQEIRALLSLKLKGMSPDSIKMQGNKGALTVINHPKYLASKRVALYLNMPKEFPTGSILEDALSRQDKKIYLPRIDSVSGKMKMLRVYGKSDLESFPTQHFRGFSLQEPSILYGKEEREEALSSGGLDLVIVPGLGFDEAGGRLGRGKGYYDKYLEELKMTNEKLSLDPPYLMGLCFDEQIVERIPMLEFDQFMNEVIHPSYKQK
eukprot:TRINITY_DN8685_c0_g1_i1.p1 TRINITY_DN8685_c0_g1~~TRINITY_DN8685_c0_g1_i1.p1  ORF type:complete len:216 (+),score=84.89 TRINITY_DN8685_c0_g1_i1:29-649(+)